MAENKNEARIPETWDELKANPMFEDIPDMVEPQELTVSQSAVFSVTDTRIDQRRIKLVNLGVFDQTSDREYDPEEASILLAEIVEYADGYFRQLAKKPKEWDTWLKGRDLFTLFLIFLNLTVFYRQALGKSDASKTRSTRAE